VVAPCSNGKRLRLSPTVTGIAESKTVVIFSKVTDMKSRGEKVNGALCVGQPDFPPPPEVVQATADAALKHKLTNYTAVNGTLELRQAICEYLEKHKNCKYTTDQILVGCGGKQVIFQAFMALCQAGDEVLIPAPYWTSYPDIAKLANATPVILETTADAGYAIDPEALAKAINPNTRILVVCNPSNPTGCMMDAKQMEAIAEVLRRPENAHVYILSDEIYERICFDGAQHVSTAALDGMWDRTLTVNGFSKAFSMTGYRLGYLAAPTEITKAAGKLQGQITSCASSIGQYAALVGLRTPFTYLDEKIKEMQSKRDLCLKLLLDIEGVGCPKPGGAFYLFPNVSAFFGRKAKDGTVIADANTLCLNLLTDYKVALVPGDAFGDPKCIRLSYAATVENIEDAVGKLKTFLMELS